MTDMETGAAAPAGEGASAIQEAEGFTPPNPITTGDNSQPQVRQEEPKAKDEADKGKTEEKKPISARDALKAAREKIEADEKAKAKGDDQPKEEKQVEAKAPTQQKPTDKPVSEQSQQSQGNDTQKPTSSPHEAPARFSPDAKAAWQSAPEPVKAEVTRAIRELEDGYQKHRADAEAFNSIRDFDDLAKRNGTTIREAMTNYTNFEQALLENPMKGLEAVCSYIGVSLREVAAMVMNQPQDQVQTQQDATIRNLMQEVDQLKRQLGGVTGDMQARQQQETFSVIDQFASDPKHSRFEELADDIAFLLDTKRAKSLPEAYALAERLNPAPVASVPAATAAPTPDLTAQTRKGSKSVTGAVASGSDPAGKRKPSSSIRESLRKAAGEIL